MFLRILYRFLLLLAVTALTSGCILPDYVELGGSYTPLGVQDVGGYQVPGGLTTGTVTLGWQVKPMVVVQR